MVLSFLVGFCAADSAVGVRIERAAGKAATEQTVKTRMTPAARQARCPRQGPTRRHGIRVRAGPTRADRPKVPFWPLLFASVTLRLISSDDFPAEAKRQAARDLTAAAAVGALSIDIGARYPLDEIAQAHDRVDVGGRGRVLVSIPQ